MNLIDKVILEWSYRTKKGYPDLNNEEDLRVFESMFGFNLKEEVKNKQGTTKAVQKIVSKFGSQYNITALPSKKNRLSAPGVRDSETIIKVIKGTFGEDEKFKEVNISGPRQNGNPSGKFFMFTFDTDEFGEVNIVASFSPPGGAGVRNEVHLVNAVKRYLDENEDSLNVVFKGSGRTYEMKNVTGVKKVGTELPLGWKADVQFYSDSSTVGNISVKQDGSFRWESINNDDTPFRENFVKSALTDPNFPIDLKPNVHHTDKKPRYLMHRAGTDDRITKVLVKNAPTDANELFTFGKDDPKTVIVGKTFDPDGTDGFTIVGNKLIIDVTTLYTDYSQLPDSLEPVFTVEQHGNLPYGLDFRIVPKEKAKLSAQGIEIDYTDVD